MGSEPLRFVGELIVVQFDDTPALDKRPHCPDRFVWQGQTFEVAEKLSEWHDYRRRGKMARNMRQTHLRAAARKGSWGVGRDYFRVRTTSGRVFDLYYDRAPGGQQDRKGSWFLYREMAADLNHQTE